MDSVRLLAICIIALCTGYEATGETLTITTTETTGIKIKSVIVNGKLADQGTGKFTFEGELENVRVNWCTGIDPFVASSVKTLVTALRSYNLTYEVSQAAAGLNRTYTGSFYDSDESKQLKVNLKET